MQTSGGIQASLSGRYAIALFELAKDERSVDAVEASLGRLRDALTESDEFKRLVTSPLVSRNEAERAVEAVAAPLGGETTAEVVSAHPLDAGQVDALKQSLRQRVGREVSVDLSVDPDLLGGLVVTIGSQRIDSSIRTRLNTLAHAMKG